MRTYLANAFSLNMLGADAQHRVTVRRVTVAEAANLASEATSCVGHPDTARIFGAVLGRDVPVNRTSVSLAPGDRVVVGQMSGERLEPGTCELPSGTVLEWLLVSTESGRHLGAWYWSPEWVEQLTDLRPEHRPDLLVGVPSSSVVLDAALVLGPKRLVLVDTGVHCRAVWTEIYEWLQAHPAAGFSLEPPPAPDDEPAGPENFVAVIEHKLGRTPRDRVALLVTSGTATHSAVMTRLAEVSGARAVHLDVPYGPHGRPNLSSPERTAEDLRLPQRVEEMYALRSARSLVRVGSCRQAIEALEALSHAGPLTQATLAWIHACEARQALRFPEAQEHLAACKRAIAMQLPHDKKAKTWKALSNLTESASDAVNALAIDGPDRALHLAAEALRQAEREASQRHFNHASLLVYRASEVAVSHRLLVAHKVETKSGIQDDWAEIAREAVVAFEALAQRQVALRRPIGLMDGLTWLAALGDEAVPGHPAPKDALSRIRNVTLARNSSILAHGFEPVTETQFADLLEHMAGGFDGTGGVVGMLGHGDDRKKWGRTRAMHRLEHLVADGTSMSDPWRRQRG